MYGKGTKIDKAKGIGEKKYREKIHSWVKISLNSFFKREHIPVQCNFLHTYFYKFRYHNKPGQALGVHSKINNQFDPPPPQNEIYIKCI